MLSILRCELRGGLTSSAFYVILYVKVYHARRKAVMRGLETSVVKLRHEVFKEVAKVAFDDTAATIVNICNILNNTIITFDHQLLTMLVCGWRYVDILSRETFCVEEQHWRVVGRYIANYSHSPQ